MPVVFMRWSGAALSAGGALLLLLNVALTPFLHADAPLEQSAQSTVFLLRQSASALSVALLLFGAIGLYLRQAERAGVFGGIAFALAFIGSALGLAWEWTDIFVLRDLAARAPDALRMLEKSKGMHLYDLGALIPITTFTLGWLALAASTIRSRPSSQLAAWLVIAGFFAIPILGGVLKVAGMIAGNVILGAGLFQLGRDVRAKS